MGTGTGTGTGTGIQTRTRTRTRTGMGTGMRTRTRTRTRTRGPSREMNQKMVSPPDAKSNPDCVPSVVVRASGSPVTTPVVGGRALRVQSLQTDQATRMRISLIRYLVCPLSSLFRVVLPHDCCIFVAVFCGLVVFQACINKHCFLFHIFC